jgi:hypothetical protein
MPFKRQIGAWARSAEQGETLLNVEIPGWRFQGFRLSYESSALALAVTSIREYDHSFPSPGFGARPINQSLPS